MKSDSKNVKIPLTTEEEVKENIELIFAGLLSSDCMKAEYETSKWSESNIVIESNHKEDMDKIEAAILQDWKEYQNSEKRTHLISLFFKKGCISHIFAFGKEANFLQIEMD